MQRLRVSAVLWVNGVNSRQRTTPDGGMVPIMQNVNNGSGIKSDLTVK